MQANTWKLALKNHDERVTPLQRYNSLKAHKKNTTNSALSNSTTNYLYPYLLQLSNYHANEIFRTFE